MKIRLKFVHLEIAEETRQLLEEQIAEKFYDLEKHGELEIKMVCSRECSRQESHGPMFECHGGVNARWLTKKIFFRAIGEDCQNLVMRCCHHLKVQVLKQTQRLRTHRVHEGRHLWAS